MGRILRVEFPFLVTNCLNHTLLTLCPILPGNSTMVFLKQSTMDGMLYLKCTIRDWGYPLCWNHLVQPLAKNEILNEYGFLCLQNIVDLFQVLISTNMFWMISLVRRTHTRREGSMPPFLFILIFLIVGGASAIWIQQIFTSTYKVRKLAWRVTSCNKFDWRDVVFPVFYYKQC